MTTPFATHHPFFNKSGSNKKYLFTILFCLSVFISAAQNTGVSIGVSEPHQSAILHIQPIDAAANPRGLLVPKLTGMERDRILTPANGLLIYNTDEKILEYYDSTKTACCWVSLVPDPVKKDIDMEGRKIQHLAHATSGADMVNKAQVEAEVVPPEGMVMYYAPGESQAPKGWEFVSGLTDRYVSGATTIGNYGADGSNEKETITYKDGATSVNFVTDRPAYHKLTYIRKCKTTDDDGNCI